MILRWLHFEIRMIMIMTLLLLFFVVVANFT